MMFFCAEHLFTVVSTKEVDKEHTGYDFCELQWKAFV